MNRKLLKVFASIVASFVVLLPTSMLFLTNVSAAIVNPRTAGTGLIPCQGATTDSSTDCNFNAFMTLINNLLTYTIILAIPTTALVAAYAGYIYITKADSPGDREKANGMFVKVLWGFVIILGAWIMVKGILSWIIDPSFLWLFTGTTK